MFGSRAPVSLSFDDHLALVKKAGFTVQTPAAGKAVALRGAYAALIENVNGKADYKYSGPILGNEIGMLTDVGYQKWFVTKSGHKIPATATHLKELHQFDDDLRAAAGVISYYNEGLGTTNTNHLYDRVEHRDHPLDHKPWEK